MIIKNFNSILSEIKIILRLKITYFLIIISIIIIYLSQIYYNTSECDSSIEMMINIVENNDVDFEKISNKDFYKQGKEYIYKTFPVNGVGVEKSSSLKLQAIPKKYATRTVEEGIITNINNDEKKYITKH